MTIRVLAVDDHDVVLRGLPALFSGTEILLTETAKSAAAAFELLEFRRPDVLLLDIRMEGGDGLTALSRIKRDHPDLPVVMFSGHNNPTYIARSAALGASGYVLKSEPAERLLEVIRASVAGEPTFRDRELRGGNGAVTVSRLGDHSDVALTQRESEVLRQLSHGLTNKEIAKMLGISYETVKEHVQHILRKVGVSDRTQAAVWAVRNHLV